MISCHHDMQKSVYKTCAFCILRTRPCNNGKDDMDIMRQCQLRKFYMCSMDVKIRLFSTYCSPMYTAQLRWHHTVYSCHRLNVAYNNVLRRLLRRRPRFCSASGLFAECRIPNCKAVIRNPIFRFSKRVDSWYVHQYRDNCNSSLWHQLDLSDKAILDKIIILCPAQISVIMKCHSYRILCRLHDVN